MHQRKLILSPVCAARKGPWIVIRQFGLSRWHVAIFSTYRMRSQLLAIELEVCNFDIIPNKITLWARYGVVNILTVIIIFQGAQKDGFAKNVLAIWWLL